MVVPPATTSHCRYELGSRDVRAMGVADARLICYLLNKDGGVVSQGARPDVFRRLDTSRSGGDLMLSSVVRKACYVLRYC